MIGSFRAEIPECDIYIYIYIYIYISWECAEILLIGPNLLNFHQNKTDTYVHMICAQALVFKIF
jgi:hypothetical protein